MGPGPHILSPRTRSPAPALSRQFVGSNTPHRNFRYWILTGLLSLYLSLYLLLPLTFQSFFSPSPSPRSTLRPTLTPMASSTRRIYTTCQSPCSSHGRPQRLRGYLIWRTHPFTAASWNTSMAWARYWPCSYSFNSPTASRCSPPSTLPHARVATTVMHGKTIKALGAIPRIPQSNRYVRCSRLMTLGMRGRSVSTVYILPSKNGLDETKDCLMRNEMKNIVCTSNSCLHLFSRTSLYLHERFPVSYLWSNLV